MGGLTTLSISCLCLGIPALLCACRTSPPPASRKGPHSSPDLLGPAAPRLDRQAPTREPPVGRGPAAPPDSQEPTGAEVVVTASRRPRDSFEIPRSITVVDERDLRDRNPLSIVDTLDEKIGVWVEKRTTTTSDPVVRGLSGGNLLALIDGNTLSTFWGEGGFAGDDIYGKIDSETIERIEVLRGPGSVLHGSNALGGVLNFITRSPPVDYTVEGWKIGGRVKGTYGSAAQELRLRTEAFGASPSVRFLAGFSARDVDDVRGGRGVGVQDPTGGLDQNFDGKLQWLPAEKAEITLSAQSVHRENLHRFYRPNSTLRIPPSPGRSWTTSPTTRPR